MPAEPVETPVIIRRRRRRFSWTGAAVTRVCGPSEKVGRIPPPGVPGGGRSPRGEGTGEEGGAAESVPMIECAEWLPM